MLPISWRRLVLHNARPTITLTPTTSPHAGMQLCIVDNTNNCVLVYCLFRKVKYKCNRRRHSIFAFRFMVRPFIIVLIYLTCARWIRWRWSLSSEIITNIETMRTGNIKWLLIFTENVALIHTTVRIFHTVRCVHDNQLEEKRHLAGKRARLFSLIDVPSPWLAFVLRWK
jgi:hypothetical protein